MNRLLSLTGNTGKLEEARHFFAPLGYEVQQFLIDGEVPKVVEPQADNLRFVTQSKIEQALDFLGTTEQRSAVLVLSLIHI